MLAYLASAPSFKSRWTFYLLASPSRGLIYPPSRDRGCARAQQAGQRNNATHTAAPGLLSLACGQGEGRALSMCNTSYTNYVVGVPKKWTRRTLPSSRLLVRRISKWLLRKAMVDFLAVIDSLEPPVGIASSCSCCWHASAAFLRTYCFLSVSPSGSANLPGSPTWQQAAC